MVLDVAVVFITVEMVDGRDFGADDETGGGSLHCGGCNGGSGNVEQSIYSLLSSFIFLDGLSLEKRSSKGKRTVTETHC